jgi:hypothetical protein
MKNMPDSLQEQPVEVNGCERAREAGCGSGGEPGGPAGALCFFPLALGLRGGGADAADAAHRDPGHEAQDEQADQGLPDARLGHDEDPKAGESPEYEGRLDDLCATHC